MSNIPKKLPKDYTDLLLEIKDRVRTAQYAALKVVNKELVGLYWDIGHLIFERQKSATWGKAVVEYLAKGLRNEFPGIGGFSTSNLWRMKNFYETYRSSEKLAPMVREIAEILVADYETKTLEGKECAVNVVLRFESEDAAMNWYNDPDYEPVKKIRLDSTSNGTATLTKQFVPPSD
ncbi:MAG: DUF1330 domain-containing protein [Candidatus Latescibacteria bacterium]|jgi:uncharacterized protein (DUF1330 family)|nr:DUF1330 domain-containing protein [Candidatus Latescibacterota bacterium]MBT5829843.1 DUF1330 domain-containing protein [Candidatus Latescibacterota bacterium]